MRRWHAAVLGLALAALLAPMPGSAQQANGEMSEVARLAVEEAELRERMMTALVIAESVRLRGRTILVAMSEISRVRRSVSRLSPDSERRAEFESRLARLEARRKELDAEVDREFLSYLEIISELAGDLWARLDRVGDDVATGLEERRLSRLRELYPLVHRHIEEFHKAETVTRGMTRRWRAEIDDTYDLRLEKRMREPEPFIDDEGKSEEDI